MTDQELAKKLFLDAKAALERSDWDEFYYCIKELQRVAFRIWLSTEKND